MFIKETEGNFKENSNAVYKASFIEDEEEKINLLTWFFQKK